MTVRLTKKRLRALSLGLCLDDVLYEKFRRLQAEVDRKYNLIYKHERVIDVYEQRGEILIALPILEVRMSSEGTRVTVGSGESGRFNHGKKVKVSKKAAKALPRS